MTGAEVRTSLVRRLAAFQAEDEAAAAAARAALPAVVALLAHEFGARRVVLFGSLASGLFRPDSDLDLAVEGIAGHRFMDALARASEVAGRPVDLIDLDWADESLREAIARQGEVLFVFG